MGGTGWWTAAGPLEASRQGRAQLPAAPPLPPQAPSLRPSLPPPPPPPPAPAAVQRAPHAWLLLPGRPAARLLNPGGLHLRAQGAAALPRRGGARACAAHRQHARQAGGPVGASPLAAPASCSASRWHMPLLPRLAAANHCLLPPPRPPPGCPCVQSMAPLHPFLRKSLFVTKIPLACITFFYYVGFAYCMMQVGGRRGLGAGVGGAAATAGGTAGIALHQCARGRADVRPRALPAGSHPHPLQRLISLALLLSACSAGWMLPSVSTSSWATSQSE